MERRTEKEESEASGSITVIDAVRRLAAHNARAPLDNEDQLLLFLQSWWSRLYNRPLKDPLLLNYTMEELLYEFFDRVERQKAEDDRVESEGDKIVEDKEKADEDWAEKMEREEREAELRAQAAKAKDPVDPTKDPMNVEWMEKQIQINKTIHGETFGEDIDESFE